MTRVHPEAHTHGLSKVVRAGQSTTLAAGEHSDPVLVAACVAEHGFPVIPLRPDDRRPLVDSDDSRSPDGRSGERHRNLWLTDAHAVIGASEAFPRQDYHGRTVMAPSWGVVLGEPDSEGWHLVVLDTDSEEAEKRLREVIREVGAEEWAEATLTVRTSRGWHRYGLTRAPVRTSQPWVGLDVKGRGGYVVLPGCAHPSGTRYRNETPQAGTVRNAGEHPGGVAVYRGVDDNAGGSLVAVWSLIRPVPDALLEAVTRGQTATTPTVLARLAPTVVELPARDRRIRGLVRKVAEAEPGQGNATLNWAAGRGAALGAPETVRDELVDAYLSRPNRDGTAEATRRGEAERTVASGWGWGSENPEAALQRAEGSVPVTVVDGAEDDEQGAVTEFDRAVRAEAYRQRVRAAAATLVAGEQAPKSDEMNRVLRPGGSFVLDTPEHPVPIWGEGARVLMAEDEALLIVGGSGVGKSTLGQQWALGRCGLRDYAELLNLPVVPGERRTLILCMDRPSQALRSLRRMVTEDDRALLDERLVIWPGPPPVKLTTDPGALLALCREAEADSVLVDSLKDTGSVVDDEGGGGWNMARQTALAEGVQVCELHHNRKGGLETLDDVYGSTWVTSGAGSVLAVVGRAGDAVVKVRHLKQPAEEVGPLEVFHDHLRGRSTVWDSTDLVALVAGSAGGLSALEAARALFEAPKPDANEKEKARRRLQSEERAGRLIVIDAGDRAQGRPRRWGVPR